MDFAEYVQKISFRLLQPTTPRPSGFRALNNLARNAGIHLEMWMTRLPEEQEEMQIRLADVCNVPRMSTFAIGAIINRAVAQMSVGHAYLNIGVWNGFTLLAGMALLEVPDLEAAEAFARADPAVAGGVLVYDVAEVVTFFDALDHTAVEG